MVSFKKKKPKINNFVFSEMDDDYDDDYDDYEDEENPESKKNFIFHSNN